MEKMDWPTFVRFAPPSWGMVLPHQVPYREYPTGRSNYFGNEKEMIKLEIFSLKSHGFRRTCTGWVFYLRWSTVIYHKFILCCREIISFISIWVVIGHYDDVIMTMLASQITSLMDVYSIVYSGVNQRIHQSSASLAFVREIHRGPVNFPHKWPVTRKMFPFDDVIMGLSDAAICCIWRKIR